jgi:small subunit ribosomal protein S3Ae
MVKKLVKKDKEKQWYAIVAPKMFDGVELGRTPTNDPKTLIGRKVSVNLMTLVNDFRKYYMKFVFKIVSIEGEKAITEFSESECMRDYISRLVVKWSRRIDTVQDLVTKDGVNVRVKCIAVIQRRIKSSIKTAVRNEIKESVKSEVERSTLEQLIEGIISDSIKKHVLSNSQKIYPMRKLEIRRTEVHASTPKTK